jgi:hypothetical protein
MNAKTSPTVTIVVPTRDRAYTLRACLETCVRQSYEGLRIIVSDNCSTDTTADVVRSFGDPRIEYVNTGRRLSMSRNWEFALGHVNSDYVTVLGDDDGFLPEAIAGLMQVITATGAQAVTWAKADYHWPDHPREELRDTLFIPADDLLFHVDASTAAHFAARFWLPYNRLPSVYNSVIRMDHIRALTARTGSFFASVTPDVYSGFALASVLGDYLYSTRPFSVNGASGRSNGANQVMAGLGAAESRAFFEEIDLDLEPPYAIVPGVILSNVAEAMARANRLCFAGSLPLNTRAVLRRLVREASGLRGEGLTVAYRGILGIALKAGLVDFCETLIRRTPGASDPAPSSGAAVAFARDGLVRLNLQGLEVHDVAGAAKFCMHQLGPYVMPRARPAGRATLLLTWGLRRFAWLR